MHPSNFYDLTEVTSADSLKFFFVSRGKRHIAKAVEYCFCQTFQRKDVYNLGFGDYDPATGSFYDEILSHNGDAYRVFHTVLHTVPLFFRHYPGALLMVQGSDSRTAFLEHCLQTCDKDCTQGCKKINRRIGIYRRFIDKHFDTLTEDYSFYGGKRNTEGKILLEKYVRGEPYEAVIFGQNFVNLGVFEEPEETFTLMKPKEKKAEALSDHEILAPVIAKFKDKVLFSHSSENAKKLLKNAESVSE